MKGSDVPTTHKASGESQLIVSSWSESSDTKRKRSSELQLFKETKILQPVFHGCCQNSYFCEVRAEVFKSQKTISKTQSGAVTASKGPSACGFGTAEDLIMLAAVSSWLTQQQPPETFSQGIHHPPHSRNGSRSCRFISLKKRSTPRWCLFFLEPGFELTLWTTVVILLWK